MSFDRIAPFYEFIERICAGGLLQRCRSCFLDGVGRARRVLILGEGDGRFLAEFLVRFPEAEVICVDSSKVMERIARRRMSEAGVDGSRVKWMVADLSDESTWMGLSGEFDLVVAHFVLDCLEEQELAAVVTYLRRLSAVDARLLVSDFRNVGSGSGKLFSRLLIRFLYFFFWMVAEVEVRRLTPPDEYLVGNGFQLQERRLFFFGMLHSDLWRAAG